MSGEILKVNMFGEFSIHYQGKTLSSADNRSKKLLTFLEYMILFRGKEVSQADLIDLLWPEENEISDPVNTLKMIIYRARQALEKLGLNGKRIIASHRGSYSWSSEGLEVVLDVDQFEKLYQQANEQVDRDKMLQYLFDAIALFKGEFLPQSSYEEWAIPISTYYHNKYIKAVKECVAILEEENSYETIIEICRKAVAIDPYDEQLHISLIEAYAASGDNHAAIAHYDSVTDMFYSKFGITPSQEFVDVYKQIEKEGNGIETDLGLIKEEDLREIEEEVSGAFFCEYGVFKEICKLESRALMRSGQVVYLCLVTVADTQNTTLEQRQLARSMEHLRDSIQSSLRIGDVFTRFSVTQYLVMLSGATFENCEMVLRRIISRFRKKNSYKNIYANYKIQALEPRQ